MKYVFAIFMNVCLMSGICVAREIYVQAGSKTNVSDGSSAHPFKTISKALDVVKPGDTVVVREGIYREIIRVPSGQPGKPVTLKAADGERVILSGAVPVTGWKKHQGNVYVAQLNFRPERLLLNCQLLPVAREPDEGWWVVSEANDVTITDPENLRMLSHDPVGGEAYIWTNQGNVFFTVPIDSLDRENGKLTVVRKSKWMTLGKSDRYYLKNHPDFIDAPGNWAIQKADGKFRVYFNPASLDDLDAVEAPYQSQPIVNVRGVEHVRISRLEVTAAVRNGIEVSGSQNVVITDCIIHNNGYIGMFLRNAKDITVRHNISSDNYCGIGLGTTSDTLIEENEIARNTMDGLIVSYNSANVTVRRNYIHHHLLWGHPDNIQLYNDVKNIRFIDNLLIAGGQSMMMAGTTDTLIQGNMVIGSRAYSLILGQKTSENYRLYNNTIAFSGLGCINMMARGNDVRENVIVSGHSGVLIVLREAERYTGDRNLFFNAHGLDRKIVTVSKKGWHRSFMDYRRSTGYDRNSVYGDPRFRCAPIALVSLDFRRLADCSRDTFYLGGGAELFKLGDNVEVDFDSILRRVIDRNKERIVISPGLRTKPVTPNLVCNWGQNKNPSWDLRLTPQSPGANLSASGGPVGSTIDIAAYQRGDFNADGKRDLPHVPAELGLEKSSEKDEEVIPALTDTK
jgi:parallel beta-helix repeat protein